MTELLWALLVILAAVVAAGTVAAVRIRGNQRRDNEVVPGVATTAPVSWAGAHSTEALLHRRIRDAVRSLRAAPGGQDMPSALRQSLEREALALDERLVAVAALPERVRTEPLERVTAAVAALEDAAAAWADSMATGAHLQVGAVDAVTERLRLLGEAREELERSYPAHNDVPGWQQGAPAPPAGATTETPPGQAQPGQSS